MPGLVEGKTALVTGAGAGIGRAAALLFAHEGAKVAVNDVNAAGAEETVGLIRAAGGEAAAFPGDVTRTAQVWAMVEGIVGAFGRLDCAFNNAGVGGELTALHKYSEEAFDRVMEVNVKGVWLCMQAEIVRMLAQGSGAIVNIASVAGLIGAPKLAAYVASKHAVVGLTRTAALEYARKGIRVNAVCPVWVQTALVEQITHGDDSIAARMAENIPLGRMGDPEEVARAVVWLSSDAASFITGAALPMDGGLTAG